MISQIVEMDHIPRLSKTVYVGLCNIIGTPTEVRIRREVDNTEDSLLEGLSNIREFTVTKSGSNREGFRLSTSDEDYMSWNPNNKVICDLSQIRLYRVPQHALILMECDGLPPGYTRLKLMSPSNDEFVKVSCVVIDNEFYIFSTLYRHSHLRLAQAMPGEIGSSVAHGPSSSCILDNHRETDFVSCFCSHHWPTLALPWIQRCRKQGWPCEIVLSDILNTGFHVVPIGSTPEKGEEWRISFSQAEQKLVHSLNHCQFLCYGLLKLFLKEVINFRKNNPFLCSYFMKTIVFWEIQSNNSIPWATHNLLLFFWRCFKLLIHWVRIGYCPNFFIPRNNMFRLKLTGSMQTSLFSQLYDLYSKGISCLLLSKAIRPFLSYAILNKSLRVCTDESSIISRQYIPSTYENSIISSFALDIIFFRELRGRTMSILLMKDFAGHMRRIEGMLRGTLTPYQAAALQFMTAEVLRNTAKFIQNSFNSKKNRNKFFYKSNRVYVLLKLSCAFGYVSDILYLAMYFYNTRRYEHSLRCIHKMRLSLPYVVYIASDANVIMYPHHVFGLSLGEKMRKTVVDNLPIHCYYPCIDELLLEQKISRKHGRFMLSIPPLVMLHMLFILNHHRLGDTVRSQQSVKDLQNLLLHDISINVPQSPRDISWQILGICQQLCGDVLGSLESYQNSLQQTPVNTIQEATLLRINSLSN